MAKVDPELSALKEQLADALAQIDSLQAAAADSEARAETQAERVAALQGELEAARADNGRLTSRLRDAGQRYRELRLAAAPGVPAELVTAEEVEEIDEQVGNAERMLAELRERMEKEQRQEAPTVPAGAPVRRAPDFSALPAAEKIKVGLEQMSQQQG